MATRPHFCFQLATLIKNQLNSAQKVYIEWGNETWNFSFATWVYAQQQGLALGLPTTFPYNGGTAYTTPNRSYTVYASVRAFTQFQNVFGVNSSRLVKVIAGQAGNYWQGVNQVIPGDLAGLQNSTINPNGVTINSYAVAPYWNAGSVGTIAAMQANIPTEIAYVQAAYNGLAGTGIKLCCYEGGSDNYATDSSGTGITMDPAQATMYVDVLNQLSVYLDGPFNQYTMYGGCWGLKHTAGEAATPKWTGWLNYWANH